MSFGMQLAAAPVHHAHLHLTYAELKKENDRLQAVLKSIAEPHHTLVGQ